MLRLFVLSFCCLFVFAINDLVTLNGGGFGNLLVFKNRGDDEFAQNSVYSTVYLTDLPSFRYFSNDVKTYIKVHYNGFITFGDGVDACLAKPGKTISQNFIAPFWAPYKEGKVYKFMLPDGEDKNKIREDFQYRYNENIADDANVLVITWLKMRSFGESGLPNGFLNTFQAFLIVSDVNDETRSYIQFYQRSLDTSLFEVNDGYCVSKHGFNVKMNTAHPLRSNKLTETFKTPQIIEFFTNDINLNNHGNWLFVTYPLRDTQFNGTFGNCDGSKNDNFKCAYRKCALEDLGIMGAIDLPPFPGKSCIEPDNLQFRNITNLNTLKNKFCEFRDPGRFGYSVICRVFVDCDLNGVATFGSCDEGMNFDPLNRICVDANQFNCYVGSDNPFPPDTEPIPTGPLPCANESAPFNGDIPDPESCSNFYSCSNGLSIIRSCPHGLFFNPKTKNCDYPRNVHRDDCEVVTTPTTTTTTPMNTTSTTKSTTTTRRVPTYRMH